MANSDFRNLQNRDYWTRGFSKSHDQSALSHGIAKLAAVAYLGLVQLLYSLLSLSFRTRPQDVEAERGLIVFAIGPFFSENWSMAHMEALCKADRIADVHLFTPVPYRKTEKLHYVTHSPRLSACLGDGVARFVNAWRLIGKLQPDLIIGYHLPWNGLTTLLLAARARAKAAYFSVGGPPELIGGGIYSEHALFSRLRREEPYIENRLITLVRKFDLILTMGTRSEAFFRSIAGDMPVVPMAVGINDFRFSMRDSINENDQEGEKYDLVSVGRLSEIKQTDLFLRVIAALARRGADVRVAIVGDGDQMNALQVLARELEILENVRFFGWIDNVEEILQRSKLFVMTSSSEGLPHSLIEAMLMGMPAIVPDVGEISDLVVDGQSGYLIRDHSIENFAECIENLLSNPVRLESFGIKARHAAQNYTVDRRVIAWNNVLGLLAPGSR